VGLFGTFSAAVVSLFLGEEERTEVRQLREIIARLEAMDAKIERVSDRPGTA
jgi:hypothetical protein